MRRSPRFSQAAWRAAKDIHRYTGDFLSGLAAWARTDHSGIARSIADMPYLGWKTTLTLLIQRLLIGVAGAILTGFLYFLLIAFGIPLLISFLFLG